MLTAVSLAINTLKVVEQIYLIVLCCFCCIYEIATVKFSMSNEDTYIHKNTIPVK